VCAGVIGGMCVYRSRIYHRRGATISACKCALHVALKLCVCVIEGSAVFVLVWPADDAKLGIVTTCGCHAA
jgi:hypothetical protein